MAGEPENRGPGGQAGEAEALFRRTGITFAVYGDDEATERLIPFDIIPRILSAAEWRRLAAGIEQRVRALNAFIYDIYYRQEIIRAGRIPEDLIIQNAAFLPEVMCVEPPRGVYAHIIGIDIVRTSENDFFMLEDNTRTPSGVSYMLENRETMMHMFPELFARNRVAAVENYPDDLRLTLESVALTNLDREPTVVVLTPGIFNSAYFEHSFLADQMGVELVEGQDLVVTDGALRMKTTQGLKQVDVVYRRVDDAFLDPLVFRRDSVLGVPGLFDVYRAGRLSIVNAPGAGRVYLKETPQTRPDAGIRALAQSATGTATIERLHSLAAAVRDRVEYVPGITGAHTGAAEALGDGKGVCQDHAHIFISAARTLDIPARYVTGYLMLDDPAPASAHHAWAEAYVEALGWVGFDVANRICPTDRYVRLACGLDAGAAPIVGSRRGGGGESLKVSVAVQQQSAQQ